MALKECELKNDGLLETFYEILGEKLNQNSEYGFYLFYGCYDVPRKGNDKTEQWESEEVYPFLTGVFAPVSWRLRDGRAAVWLFISGIFGPEWRSRSDCMV